MSKEFIVFSSYKIPVTRSLMTEQTKHKLILAFKEFNYEERQPEFNLEHVIRSFFQRSLHWHLD